MSPSDFHERNNRPTKRYDFEKLLNEEPPPQPENPQPTAEDIVALFASEIEAHLAKQKARKRHAPAPLQPRAKPAAVKPGWKVNSLAFLIAACAAASALGFGAAYVTSNHGTAPEKVIASATAPANPVKNSMAASEKPAPTSAPATDAEPTSRMLAETNTAATLMAMPEFSAAQPTPEVQVSKVATEAKPWQVEEQASGAARAASTVDRPALAEPVAPPENQAKLEPAALPVADPGPEPRPQAATPEPAPVPKPGAEAAPTSSPPTTNVGAPPVATMANADATPVTAPVVLAAVAATPPPVAADSLPEPFKMGSLIQDCSNCPQLVAVVGAESFALGRSEVTFDDWDACVAAGACTAIDNDSGWGRGKRPVIFVSYEDVTRQFLPWLSKLTGHVYRLPSRAEWLAAEAADQLAGTDDCFNSAGQQGDACKDSSAGTVPAASYKPGKIGLYDMQGNVWEWTTDCWKSFASSPNPDPAKCDTHYVMGGAWSTQRSAVLKQAYAWEAATKKANSIGFRVARSLP